MFVPIFQADHKNSSLFSSLSFKKKLSNYTLYTASIKMTKMVRSILIYSDLSYFHVNREIWKFSGKFE